MKRRLIFVSILLFSASLRAQDVPDDGHGHADIEFSYVDGVIDVDFGDEGAVFEGTFPTEGIDRQSTSEPGFASDLDENRGIGTGDQIVYNVLENLVFWNHEFQAVPTGVQLRVVNQPPAPLVPETVVSATSGVVKGSFAPALNRIGSASDEGDFHHHVRFVLEPNDAPHPVNTSTFGLYGVKMNLATDAEGIAASDPFFLVFNFGLDEATFEEGVESFARIVPEPGSSTWAVIAASALYTGYRRKRSTDSTA